MSRSALLIALLTILGCATVAPTRVNVNPRFETFHIRRVAILPFEGIPVDKEIEQYYLWWRHNVMNNGEVISDIFTTEMMAIAAFDYVERSQIRRILQEQNISVSELMQGATASEIGKLLGADAVIVGKVNNLDCGFNIINMRGGWVSFSVRMVDTPTGTVLWSATVDRQLENTEVLKAAREECARIVSELKTQIPSGTAPR